MMSPSLSDFQRLSAELEGVLHLDATMRTLYATDASVYREMPQAVALPKSEGDICKLVRFAGERRRGQKGRRYMETRPLLGLAWHIAHTAHGRHVACRPGRRSGHRGGCVAP